MKISKQLLKSIILHLEQRQNQYYTKYCEFLIRKLKNLKSFDKKINSKHENKNQSKS